MAHHRWWNSTAKPTVEDFGVPIHECAMRVLECHTESDQVAVENLSGIESMMRQAQVAEHFHAYATKEAEMSRLPKKDGKSTLSSDEIEPF